MSAVGSKVCVRNPSLETFACVFASLPVLCSTSSRVTFCAQHFLESHFMPNILLPAEFSPILDEVCLVGLL
jgi:hypothetical protein